MTGALDQARADESSLRARLADAVTERARANREAERLEARASLPGADATLSTAATAQYALAERAAAQIEMLRLQLRRAEAEVVTLETALDTARAGQET